MRLAQPCRTHVELEQIALAADCKHACRASGKANRRAMDEDVSRGERCMAAQLDLTRRSEPAQLIIGVLALTGDRKDGLAEIVLASDGLHQPIVEPALERHHRRGISSQRSV